MSVESSVIRIPKFNGKRENFAVWSSQFVAVCTVKGISEALLESFENELPTSESETLNPSDEGEKKKLEAKVKNNLAMSYLVIASDSAQLQSKIDATKSSQWPSGLAYKFMKSLKKKYKPSDAIAEAEVSVKLNKLKLDEGDDPDELADRIATIESQYGVVIEEKQKVIAIVSAGGKFYADVILTENKAARKAGTSVDPDDLIEAMSEKWRVSGGVSLCEEIGKTNEQETVLGSVQTKGEFKGDCYKCGKFGHRAAECKMMSGPNGNKCDLCDKTGHWESMCWEDEKNAHKRPKGWKSVKTQTSGCHVEILVSCVDVKQKSLGVESLLANVNEYQLSTGMPCDLGGVLSLYPNELKLPCDLGGVLSLHPNENMPMSLGVEVEPMSLGEAKDGMSANNEYFGDLSAVADSDENEDGILSKEGVAGKVCTQDTILQSKQTKVYERF